MTEIRDVLGNVPAFLDAVFAELAIEALDVSTYTLDHLCFRVATPGLYSLKKQAMEGLGRLLSEALINGRPIATYQLTQAIVYRDRVFDVVEIPFPKPGVVTKTGLEHVEFVIAEDFTSFMRRYPAITFDQVGLHKPHNPELVLRLRVGNVKFHHTALKDLIALEQQGVEADVPRGTSGC